MYYGDIRRPIVEAYKDVIDGVVVAYPQSREEISDAWTVLNDAMVLVPGEISYPWNTPSRQGDHLTVSQSAKVLDSPKRTLRFRQRDDFRADTLGYHVKQLLVNNSVVWEEDVAGGTNDWIEITVDVTAATQGNSDSRIAFRMLDKRGVSNFGVHWRIADLQLSGLRLAAGLDEPAKWAVTRQGAFETAFGQPFRPPARQFHVPFIVMTSGQISEFRDRHGEPATPERVAEWVRMSLQALKEGKCDGVVTYCLEKGPGSRTFDLVRNEFLNYLNQASRPKR